jgi:putative ABC transport system permease protein
MEIGPLLRALFRNKIGVVLIALQIAFTMTVMVNAVFIINERSKAMARPSGLDEPNMFYLRSTGFGEQFNSEVTEQDDLELLQNTPGIIDATAINSIPVSGSGSSTSLRLENDPTLPAIPSAIYYTDDHALNTMGLNLIAGENFTSNEVLYQTTSEARDFGRAVISLALAEALFPEEGINSVGRTFFNGEYPIQIAGIVERLQAPWPNSSFVEQAMIVPLNFISATSTYLIRTEPGERDRLMVETEAVLAGNNPNRIIRDLQSIDETREESYRLDSAMATILFAVIVTLVFITSMGIVGLAVFGINRRRKQIGTRRALGATRGEILRYFMLENFFISGVGVTLGAIFTIAFSIVLSSLFESPTMSWYYTPLGMIILIAIGQIAVLGPSTRAARIQPAIATRSI